MFYGRKKLNKRIDVLDAADFVRLEFERSDGGYEQTSRLSPVMASFRGLMRIIRPAAA